MYANVSRHAAGKDLRMAHANGRTKNIPGKNPSGSSNPKVTLKERKNNLFQVQIWDRVGPA
jgi:hypothetical protein